LHYSRHFALLAAFACLAWVASRLSFPASLAVAFALYGALHATALVVSLRRPPSLGRSGLLIAAATVLSAMVFHLGLLGTHLSARMPGVTGPYITLGFASIIGALAYGIALRIFTLYRLTAAELSLISLGCASASCLALMILTRFPLLGPWWLAVLWWYSFSGGLWLCDQRQQASKFTR
jgi:hypothetical protein